MNELSEEKLDRAIRMLHVDRFGFSLSNDEACKIYDAAVPEFVSRDMIQSMVRFATGMTPAPASSHVPMDWLRLFPVKAMKRLNFSLPKNLSDAEAILSFFGANDKSEIEDRFESTAVAYRQASSDSIERFAVAAWIREAELVAGMIPSRRFDESQLRASIHDIRQLTRSRIDKALTQVQEICASAGLAFVMVPELPSTRISGCARWLNDGRPMIGLTVRYKTDDQLWFTFFHELGHVLLHSEHLSFVLDNSEQVTDSEVDPAMMKIELEANEFARDALVPRESFDRFVAQGIFTNDSVLMFAEAVGIAPGIIVGRLQREKLIEYHQGNAFKQRLDMQPTFDGEEA